MEDALALEAAGCFAIVMEMVPAPVAAKVTEALRIPTIGIGAGPHCDAQVLVWQDMAGLRGGPGAAVRQEVRRPAHRRCVTPPARMPREVASGAFPAAEHSFES